MPLGMGRPGLWFVVRTELATGGFPTRIRTVPEAKRALTAEAGAGAA